MLNARPRSLKPHHSAGEGHPTTTPLGNAQKSFPAQSFGINGSAPAHVAVVAEVAELHRVLGHTEYFVHQEGVFAQLRKVGE